MFDETFLVFMLSTLIMLTTENNYLIVLILVENSFFK